jgi:hypothetical protein
LQELRDVRCDFDLTRLIRLCEELNITWREGAYFATGMLVRAVLDHVPPMFGRGSFDEVANNVSAKSFKAVALKLGQQRKIIDALLHTHASAVEQLPTDVQVDVTNALDLLLGEVLRAVRSKPSPEKV